MPLQSTTSDSMCVDIHCGGGTVMVPSSPVPELLGTNAIPSSSQERAIRETLPHVERDISSLDEKITQVSSILHQLQTERLVLQQFSEEHRAFLSPARRLYPELWAEIFLQCSRGSFRRRFHELLDSFDALQGPLLLTHVCSNWRKIALSTPSLWSLIRIALKQEKDSQHELVNAWLERSGAYPLTIGIMEWKSTWGHSEFPDNLTDNEALQALLRQSHRWETVFIMIPPSPAAWQVFAPIQNNLPMLRRLTINISRGLKGPRTFTLDYFDNAPQLAHIGLDYYTTVSGVPLSANAPFQITVPSEQLTSLEFRMHRQTPALINTCLSTIPLLPNIQTCVLRCGTYEPWLPAINDVVHQQIRNFTIVAEPVREGSIEKGLGNLFLRLTLPSLRRLTLRSIANGRKWNHEPFASFLSRSSDLDCLKINCEDIPGPHLVEALREVPNLTILSVRVNEDTMCELLRCLALQDIIRVQPEFLSKLKNLKLESIDGTFYHMGVLDMLDARVLSADVNKVARLESFRIRSSWSFLWDRSFIERLESYRIPNLRVGFPESP